MQQTTAAHAAIKAAEDVGAQKVPEAELHLKLARDQVEAAEALAEKGESERANSVLLRAQADAELAFALARKHAAREQAENMTGTTRTGGNVQ